MALSRLAQVQQLDGVSYSTHSSVSVSQPYPTHTNPRAHSCDWFSADALYTILPNTTDLGALTFPEGRTYVAIGVNQPRLRKAVYR